MSEAIEDCFILKIPNECEIQADLMRQEFFHKITTDFGKDIDVSCFTGISQQQHERIKQVMREILLSDTD